MKSFCFTVLDLVSILLKLVNLHSLVNHRRTITFHARYNANYTSIIHFFETGNDMLQHPQITQSRIERFHQKEILKHLWDTKVEMQVSIFQPAGELVPADAPNQTFTPIKDGHAWGPIWSDAWFKLEGKVPAEWKGENVALRGDFGSEAILWQGDEPLQGLDNNHMEYRLLEPANGGETFTLYVRANGMNPNVSVDGRPEEPSKEPFTFKFAWLVVMDEQLQGLHYDLLVGLDLLKHLPENEPRRARLLYALNVIVNAWEPDNTDTLRLCREIFAAEFNHPAGEHAHKVTAIGHSHIDTAWLWPLERTHQKCLHTFSTATHYMDQYPEYRFVCSQAAQYAWVKEMAPKLYDRIREKIKAGQWEVEGSMWVEADCNITGGESLVRQILISKNFWMEEFGVETETLWLPDVFGYAAALPQILKKSGVNYFMTQKISWNQTNKFPHHTMYWQGIDGTKIFTHFPPADTYNAVMTPGELIYNVHNFKEKDRSERSLYLFGYGDGGGGPTVQMLESARRMADTEGLPTVKQELATEFFHKAEAEARDLPVWVGELYLELHRGTLTTQAHNKRGNRKSEFLLRDVEFLSAILPDALKSYPRDTLDMIWKLTLLNQFHDIIPGSSINEVYRDSDRDYAEIEKVGEEAAGLALTSLGKLADTRGLANPVMVVRNWSDDANNETAQVELPEGVTPKSAAGPGGAAPVQIIEDKGVRSAIFVEPSRQSGHGYAIYDLLDQALDQEGTIKATTDVLDNGVLRVEFDEHGLISRLYDYENDRDTIAAGQKANAFQLFEDVPLFWEAWDVDIFYQEKGRTITELDSAAVTEVGPVRGAVKFIRSFGSSRIEQTVRLSAGSRRLEFVTYVDWHEEHKMLKTAFPVAVNSARATYEIQYGHLERPTHMNTSWDMARFEVAAQKWVDISEGSYGVALLNDCKYGHDTQENVMRLTLLRSPKAPDPEADMGSHDFTYALLPHAGDLRQGGVVANAYHLNNPSRAIIIAPDQLGSLPREQVFFSVDRPNIVIEAVKMAEKENALIVRLYDTWNSRCAVKLKTTIPAKSASLCDLLERDQQELAMEDGQIDLYVLPFEIITVKLRLE